MTINAVLEADLRSISAEARRRFPAVKDAAERGILKHADGSEEAVQLKVLQTVLTVLQSQLHPKDEESMAIILGICLRLAGSTRQLDCVHSTATATLRQAIALIFDRAASSEGLPVQCAPRQANRVWNTSEPGDISRIVMASRATEGEGAGRGGGEELETVVLKERVDDLSPAARMGLRLLEDLAALAAGQQAQWLHVPSLQRTFALEMLEYVVSHYATLFRRLTPYQQVLQHKLCALVMTSLRSTGSEEGDVGEPGYRRLVLRCVATLVRQHHAQLTTECEVFLLMLVKSVDQDLPLWHRILVLEVLRGFCVEPGTLQLIFNLFDMQPGNSSIVEEMAVALAHVVQSVQVPESSEESLAAVAGMFSSKARAGVEWSMDFDWAGNAVVAASEAHAITLAVEGLLGIVFTIALLTDEAMDDSHPYSASPPKSPLAPRKQPDAQAVAQGGGAAATDGASGVGGRQGEEGASPVSPPSPRVPGKHAALLAESDSHAPSPGLTRGLLALLGGMQEEGDGSEWVKKGAQDDEDAESRGGSAEGRVRGALEELCVRMVDAVWKTVLDALSIILARSQGEAVILEILRAYQAFTQACGALDLVDPRDEFLASLCRFTLVASPSMSTMAPPGQPFDSDRFQMPSSPSSAYLSPMRSLDALLGTESRGDLLASTMGSAAAASAAALGQGVPVLTPKNMHALRTLFNVSHRLCAVLGPSWELVMETLAALDRTIHSPYATSQDVSASASTPSAGSRGSKELTGAPSSLQSDFSVLATLDAQLFQSTAHMDTAAVLALLAALRVVSNRALHSVTTGLGIAASGSSAAAAAAGTSAAAAAVASPLSTGALPSTLKMFAVERMLSVLSHNMHRMDLIWDAILLHLLELAVHESAGVRAVAVDAIDRAVMAALASPPLHRRSSTSSSSALTSATPTEEQKGEGACRTEGGEGGEEREGQKGEGEGEGRGEVALEEMVVGAVSFLWRDGRDAEVKAGALRILLHMLEVSPGHTCNRFHRAHFTAVLFLSHSNPTAVMGRDGLEQHVAQGDEAQACAGSGVDRSSTCLAVLEQKRAAAVGSCSLSPDSLCLSLMPCVSSLSCDHFRFLPACLSAAPWREAALHLAHSSQPPKVDIPAGATQCCCWGHTVLLLLGTTDELTVMVAATNDKDLVGLAFQSELVVVNDCLSSIPPHTLQLCVEVVGAFAGQVADVNISLTSVGLLWTMADFFARGLDHATTTHRTATFSTLLNQCDLPASSSTSSAAPPLSSASAATSLPSTAPAAGASALKLPASATPSTFTRIHRKPAHTDAGGAKRGEGAEGTDVGGAQGRGSGSGRMLDERSSALLLAVLCVMETRAKDGRPEVRNAAMRTLFQTVVSHGAKLPPASWRHCLWDLIFPLIDSVRSLAATASRDEAPGMEIGRQGGRSVMMLVHHSRNTAQKQWDETLVMALNGLARLIRAFFSLLHTMDNFREVWGALLQFVEEGVLTGSREVSSAAASTLQTIMLTHATKVSIMLTHATKVNIMLTHATKVSIILTHATKVSIILTHATKVSIILTHATKVSIILTHATKVSIILTHATKVSIILTHATKVSIILTHATKVSIILTHATKVSIILTHATKVSIILTHATKVSIILTHATKGSIPRHYWDSSMDAYELLLRDSTAPASAVAVRTRQKLVEDLGEVYSTAGLAFEDSDYLRLLACVDVMARCPVLPSEPPPLAGTLPQVQRTVLEVLPRLQPSAHAHLWPALLQQLLAYLPGGDRLLCPHCRVPPRFLSEATQRHAPKVALAGAAGGIDGTKGGSGADEGRGRGGGDDGGDESGAGSEEIGSQGGGVEGATQTANNGSSSRTTSFGLSLGGKVQLFAPAAVYVPTSGNPTGSFMLSYPVTAPGALSPALQDRVVALLLELFLNAPPEARDTVLPDLVAALGRCMLIRRTSPDLQLWRTAVATLSDILKHALPPDPPLTAHANHISPSDPQSPAHPSSPKHASSTHHHTKHQHEARKEVAKEGNGAVGGSSEGGRARQRMWQELAAVVEQFVLGTCGTALLPDLPSPAPQPSPAPPPGHSPRRSPRVGRGEGAGGSPRRRAAPGSGGGSGAGRAPEAGGASVPAGRGVGEAESSDWGTGSEGRGGGGAGSSGWAGEAGSTRGVSELLTREVVEADEMLEALFLDTLCTRVLTHCHDAPHKERERLVAVLDACAARTSALPLAAAAALPTHCARFSLACLSRLFMLAGQGRPEDTVASSSVAVGRLVLPRLVARCHAILHRFTADSLQAGSAAMPAVRLAEMLLLLQELVRLVLHPLVAAAVDVPIAPKASAEAHTTAQAAAAGDTLTRGELERPWERESAARRFVDSEGRQLGWQRAHLLLLYSPLCDLVFLRDADLSNLCAIIFRLIGNELGLLRQPTPHHYR
ncbi:unnamed protein product [Closterium sp. NIES-65]|nr:unnamed protein product [Closterium sp. NIES-65]